MVNSLPIYDLKEQFIEALRSGNQVILSAPPGSGKSTHVPQFIADEVISAAAPPDGNTHALSLYS